MFDEKEIFGKWLSFMYDKTVTEDGDVKFLLSFLGRPMKILEACCGSGRVLVPLARAGIGHDVTGFDTDKEMLGRIPAKACGLPNIRWRQMDAVAGDWGTGYDCVILAANILFNITSGMGYAESQELFVKKAAAATVGGGIVYIDYCPGGHRVLNENEESHSHGEGEGFTAFEGEDDEGNAGFMRIEGGSYDGATRMDKFTRKFELRLKNGEAIRQEMQCAKHFAPLQTIRGWIRDAGLTIEREYGGYGREELNGESTRAIVIAKKTI